MGRGMSGSVRKKPEHIALIMDGNGRWAKKRHLPRYAGHNAGMKVMKEIVRFASDFGIKHLSVYAFSTENWKRSAEEISGIFKLLVLYVENELAELNRENVRIKLLGDPAPLPRGVQDAINRAEHLTEKNTGMQFNICINYGGREDIRLAAARLCELAADGKVDPQRITVQDISANLYTGLLGVPDPDLVVRTSGEERISNFLLWQIAYSEFAFTETLWPDFTPDELKSIIDEYMGRERRFGGRCE